MPSTKPQYEIFAEEYPGTVILQRQGKFYTAFGKSAIAVSDILHYKLSKTSKGTYKCGIPETVLLQRLERIKAVGVGYVVYENDKITNKHIVADKSVYDHITTDFVYLPRNNVEKKPQAMNECVSDNVIEAKTSERNYQKYVLLDSVYERFKQFCISKPGFDPNVCFNWIVDEGLNKCGF